MGWFGSKKKEEKKEPTAQEIAHAKQMQKEKELFERQKANENLGSQVNKFEAKIDKTRADIENYNNQIKA